MGTKWVPNFKTDDWDWVESEGDLEHNLLGRIWTNIGVFSRPPKPNYRPSESGVTIGDISFDRGNTSPSVREISAEVVKQSTPGMVAGAAAPVIIAGATGSLEFGPAIAAAGRTAIGYASTSYSTISAYSGAAIQAAQQTAARAFTRYFLPIVGLKLLAETGKVHPAAGLPFDGMVLMMTGHVDPEEEEALEAEELEALRDADRKAATEEMLENGTLSFKKSTRDNIESTDAANRGTYLHQDEPDRLPDQLRKRYPDTQFRFRPQGERGQDVEWKGGKHPSAYPGSDWPFDVNHADFKPDTLSGWAQFIIDQATKWAEQTKMLPYDPQTGRLR